MRIWLPIEDYPGYEVSDDGAVRSNKYSEIRELVCRLNSKGYARVNLCKDGKYRSRFIHRLVLSAFTGANHLHLQVHHRNFIKHDNRKENLQWVTSKEHKLYSHGIRVSPNGMPHGEKHHFARLKDGEAWLAKRLSDSGISRTYIAKMFNVSRCCISDIACRRKWKHLGSSEGVMPTSPS